MTRGPIVSYNDEKQNHFGSLYHKSAETKPPQFIVLDKQIA